MTTNHHENCCAALNWGTITPAINSLSLSLSRFSKGNSREHTLENFLVLSLRTSAVHLHSSIQRKKWRSSQKIAESERGGKAAYRAIRVKLAVLKGQRSREYSKFPDQASVARCIVRSCPFVCIYLNNNVLPPVYDQGACACHVSLQGNKATNPLKLVLLIPTSWERAMHSLQDVT